MSNKLNISQLKAISELEKFGIDYKNNDPNRLLNFKNFLIYLIMSCNNAADNIINLKSEFDKEYASETINSSKTKKEFYNDCIDKFIIKLGEIINGNNYNILYLKENIVYIQTNKGKQLEWVKYNIIITYDNEEIKINLEKNSDSPKLSNNKNRHFDIYGYTHIDGKLLHIYIYKGVLDKKSINTKYGINKYSDIEEKFKEKKENDFYKWLAESLRINDFQPIKTILLKKGKVIETYIYVKMANDSWYKITFDEDSVDIKDDNEILDILLIKTLNNIIEKIDIYEILDTEKKKIYHVDY